MKIGVVVDNDFDSDIRVKKEVSLLRKNGYEVFVLAFGDETKKDQKEERIFLSKRLRNILFVLMNRLPIYEMLWSYWVKDFINKYDIDIIHTHDLYMSKCCRKGIEKSDKNCKLVLDLHENFPHAINSYSWAIKKLNKF